LVIRNLLNLPTEELEEQKDEEGVEGMHFNKLQYMSTNPSHPGKRRDVAMILMGVFIEDIQMYCIRNPQFNLTQLIDEIVRAESPNSYLRGRTLWCASTCSESLLLQDE
jgi:hypothetical protein